VLAELPEGLVKLGKNVPNIARVLNRVGAAIIEGAIPLTPHFRHPIVLSANIPTRHIGQLPLQNPSEGWQAEEALQTSIEVAGIAPIAKGDWGVLADGRVPRGGRNAGYIASTVRSG
jgi:hypothetical protein